MNPREQFLMFFRKTQENIYQFGVLKKYQKWDVALLIALPLLIDGFYKGWFLSNSTLGWLDQFCNTGFFLHYTDPTYIGCSYYKISRLSWIIPGFLVYKIFSPLVATLILHIGFIVLTAIFLYLMLHMVVPRNLAFLTALFLEFYLPIQGSGGWDYQNLPSGAYYCMTLYFLTRAARSTNASSNLFLAGASFAATLSSVIQFVNMFPVLVLWYLFLSQKRKLWRYNLFAINWFSLGCVFLTLCLCIVNWLVGRQFFFFKPIVDVVFHMVKDPSTQKSWWQPWSIGWVTQAEAIYLFFPTILFLASLVHLASRFRRMRNGLTIGDIMVLQFLLSSFLWIIWQSLGQTSLEPSYFAYPLYIPMLIGFAGMMVRYGSREEILKKNSLKGPLREIILASIFFSTLLLWKIKFLQGITSETSVVFHLYPWLFVVLMAAFLLLLRLTPDYFLPITVPVFFLGYLLIQGADLPQYLTDGSIDRCADSKLFIERIEMDHSLSKFSSEQSTGILWDPKVIIKSKNPKVDCSFNLTNFAMGFVEEYGHVFSFASWDKDFLENSDPKKIPDKYYLSQNNQTVGIISTDPAYVSSVVNHFHAVGRLKMHVVEHVVIIARYYLFYFDVLSDKDFVATEKTSF